MFKLEVSSSFSAAHFLLNYKGKCESLHGHNWKVNVIVSGKTLDSSGMIMDFGILKSLLYDILETLDHRHLNEIEYFTNRSPSSEEISRYIFINIQESISKNKCILEAVKVWETDTSCATYTKNNIID